MQIYEFGDFRLDCETPSLWLGGELVSVSPKALEILVLLVRKNGEIVSREEILEEIWNDSIVEEANINYNVSLLRKFLGAKDLIQTVPKRGYRFAAEIRQPAETTSELDRPVSKDNNKLSNQPAPKPLINRKRIPAIAAAIIFLFISVSAYFLIQKQSVGVASAADRNIQSLAVLPFRNLEKDDQDNSVALGLTDSIISRLGSLKRFSVRPFSAVEGFTKGGKDALTIGKELNCDAVLVGTIQTRT